MRRAKMVTIAMSVAALALGACSDDSAAPPSSTAASTTSVGPASTSTTSPTAATSTTVASTTAPPPTTSPTTASTPPTSAVPVPSAVREVNARPGGGSGEIVVTWRGVAGASGYRVQRGSAVNGPFTIGADLDTATGRLSKANDVVNVYAVGDGTFSYVEVPLLSNVGAQRWFQVVAYSTGGSAAPSPTVCGAPPGAPAC